MVLKSSRNICFTYFDTRLCLMGFANVIGITSLVFRIFSVSIIFFKDHFRTNIQALWGLHKHESKKVGGNGTHDTPRNVRRQGNFSIYATRAICKVYVILRFGVLSFLLMALQDQTEYQIFIVTCILHCKRHKDWVLFIFRRV